MSDQVRQAFKLAAYVPIQDWYRQLPTKLLLKIHEGFHRDFDARSAGDEQRQPIEWLSKRIWIIDQILEEREVEGKRKPLGEKMWSRVDAGQAQVVKGWNVKVHRNGN